MEHRRILAAAIAVVMLASAFTACRPKDEPAVEEPDHTPQPGVPAQTPDPEEQEGITMIQEIGSMIPLTALDEDQAKIVNDSGMSGTGGRIHLHSNRAADMIKDLKKTFVFDIGHTEKLGQLWVWNYNASDRTSNGLKDVLISLSEDGESWSEPTAYTLRCADGENNSKATNLEDGSVVDFCGANGRYLKIEALSNYGGDWFGLSEIRLFRYKQPITEGAYISASPLERFINGKWSALPEHYEFVNGSGLDDFRSSEAKHDNLPEHMFSQKATAIDFIVDLKGEYPLSKLVLWNYNDPEHLDWGLQKFRLKISDDCSSWKTIGTYTLPQGDGSAALAPSLSVAFAEEVRGHYIQIEIMSNYGGSRVGLSEISAFLGSGWFCDEVPDYSALFSCYSGWTGADGIYTVNLDGKDYDFDRDPSQKKTFFIFSDTIVSTVDPITKLRSGVYMPNNTNAVLTGGEPDCTKILFNYPKQSEAGAIITPSSPIPATKAGKLIYYWLGDTFVSGGFLYVFALRIDSVNTVFGFEQIGVDLARYRIVNGEVDPGSLEIIEDLRSRLCDVSDPKSEFYFGGAVFQSTQAAGALDPDGYVYIYGYNDVENAGRKLIVSRVLPENIENFSEYEYLDADGNWVGEVPAKFRHLADDVAPEISISQIQDGPYLGKFLLINTHITNTPVIKASVSDLPYGVFDNKTTVFVHDTCLVIPGSGNNTYNAKAHPALSGRDEIIISYNVNGNDCFKYADIYRPRFLRLATVKSGG